MLTVHREAARRPLRTGATGVACVTIVCCSMLPVGARAQDPDALSYVTGSVVDAETRRPVQDAVVSVPALERTTLTRADGAFTLVDVPAGTQILVVRRIGYAVLTRVATVRAPATDLRLELAPVPLPLDGLDVTVASSAAVRGRIMNGGSGAPMPDVFVWLTTEERGVTSDSTGAFVFADARPGPGVLQVEEAGYGHRLVPVIVEPGVAPVTIVLQPDSAALKGMQSATDRLRARRNRYPSIVRTFDAARLRSTPVEDARLVVQNYTFATIVACQGIARSHWCVDVNGRPVEARVCIDGAPAMGGLDDLQQIRPHELHTLEVYGTSGAIVRAYTHGYLEQMARSALAPPGEEPVPQRAGVEGLGWAPRGSVEPGAAWTGPRC